MTRTASVFVWSIVSLVFVVGQNNGLRSPPPQIACAGHADGLYLKDPTACNNGFYKCANGRSFYYQCPQDLFFSIEDAQCEYKQAVPACGGVRAVKQQVAPVAAVHQLVAPAIPAQPIAPIYPISYVASTAQPVALVASVVSQQPQYAQTTAPPAPQAPAQTTPTPTQPPSSAQPVYTTQATTPAPKYQPAAEAPVALVAMPAEYAASVASQYPQSSAPVAPQASAQTAAPPVDFNCGNNADGYYFKQACTSTYYSCVGGQAMKMACASNTVYDPAVQRCDYSDVCGKPRPATTTTQRPPSTAPPSTACVGKADGFYEKGRCQNAYLHCSNGHAFDLTCPSQLAFTGVQCAYQNDCLNPTTPAPVAVQTSTVSAPPRSQWCQENGKSDGFFGNGCTSKFYACGSGFTTEISCPTGLVYDSTINSCDRQQFVVACGGVRPVTTTTVAAPVAPVRPVNFNCAGKPDGYYSGGCSTSFFSCIGGAASEHVCVASTRYSPQLSTCDWPKNIPECGGQLPTTTAAAPVAPVAPAVGTPAPQSYGYQTAAPSAPVAPIVSQPPRYEQPPAPVAVQTRPPTTTYNPPTAPVYTPPPTTQPPATTSAPIYPVVVPAQPIAPVANLEDYDANPCEKLADGIYGRRCSRHYFVCSVNKTYEFTCPSGYAYDRQLARCGPKSGIANCSSATPVVSAPQAAAYSG